MEIHESGEMYLETIYILKKNLNCVKAIDVSNALSVSRASTSRALKHLKEFETITTDDKGCIFFTKKGEEIASRIYNRHVILTEFFEKIGVDQDTAAQDACKIEHYISNTSVEKIKEFLNKK